MFKEYNKQEKREEIERQKYSMSTDILYRPQAEYGTRLAKQLTKLCRSLAVVDGYRAVTYKAYRLAERAAMDTATGFHVDIVLELLAQSSAVSGGEVAKLARIPMNTCYRVLEDMLLLDILVKEVKEAQGARGRRSFLYSISNKVQDLWRRAKIGLSPTSQEKELR